MFTRSFIGNITNRPTTTLLTTKRWFTPTILLNNKKISLIPLQFPSTTYNNVRSYSTYVNRPRKVNLRQSEHFGKRKPAFQFQQRFFATRRGSLFPNSVSEKKPSQQQQSHQQYQPETQQQYYPPQQQYTTEQSLQQQYSITPPQQQPTQVTSTSIFDRPPAFPPQQQWNFSQLSTSTQQASQQIAPMGQVPWYQRSNQPMVPPNKFFANHPILFQIFQITLMSFGMVIAMSLFR